MKSELKADLKILRDYLEFLILKHGDESLPKWAKGKRPSKMARKEIERVSKRVNELGRCKRHGGIYGLDCSFCNLEGSFTRVLG